MGRSKTNHITKKLFWMIGGIFLIGFYLWSTDIESINGNVLQIENSISKQLYSYFQIHKSFPDSLVEADIVSTYRLRFFYLIQIRYKPSVDKQDFRLAAKTRGFVVYCLPNWLELDKSTMTTKGFQCLGSFALEENSTSSRFDLPIYRKSPQSFPDPYIWPIVD